MRLILGGPGCGKTTALVQAIKKQLSNTAPEKVAFIAFTRKAAQEARQRCAEHLNLDPKEMPYFRTIHALCFRQLNMRSGDVMQPDDYDRIAKDTGLEITNPIDAEYGLPTGGAVGDKIIFLEQLARSTGQNYEKLLQANFVNVWQGKLYKSVLEAYKKNEGLYDFTDMIDLFLAHGGVPSLKLLVVDEAQDLSALHWRVVDKLAENTPALVIGGDDDQAIFRWAGADLPRFLSLSGTRTVLPVSHRLPKTVFNLANKIAGRIQHRYKKVWQPRDEKGMVQALERFDNLAKELGTGTWYCLARHAYMLPRYKTVLDWSGYVYEHKGVSSTDNLDVKALLTWERLRSGKTIGLDEVKLVANRLNPSLYDEEFKRLSKMKDTEATFTLATLKQQGLKASPMWVQAIDMPEQKREYYRKCLMHGETLTGQPRIKLATVHGVKGGEADNVVITPDMSAKANRELLCKPDNEHRVFYTAATRARHRLFLLYPKGGMRYEF